MQQSTEAGTAPPQTEIEVRPNDGLRQGPIAVPAWVVWATATAVVVLALSALAYRIARSRR